MLVPKWQVQRSCQKELQGVKVSFLASREFLSCGVEGSSGLQNGVINFYLSRWSERGLACSVEPRCFCLSAIRFRFLTRLSPACRRKPGARLPPPRLRAPPSRTARSFRRKKPNAVSRGPPREHAIAFDGLPRSPLQLATPVSPTGKGCSSCCNPNPKATGAEMSDKNPEQLSPEIMRQFTGSEHWYRHAINRKVVFTDGASMLPITAALTGCSMKSRSTSVTTAALPSKDFRCGR